MGRPQRGLTGRTAAAGALGALSPPRLVVSRGCVAQLCRAVVSRSCIAQLYRAVVSRPEGRTNSTEILRKRPVFGLFWGDMGRISVEFVRDKTLLKRPYSGPAKMLTCPLTRGSQLPLVHTEAQPKLSYR